MKFDSTVNLGHMITLFAMLLGGTAAYTNIQIKLTELNTVVRSYQTTLNDHEMRLRDLERK